MGSRAFASGLLVCCLVGAGALSAQNPKFDAEVNRLHQEAVAARAAKKLDIQDPALEKQYPYSVITATKVQKLAPGASAMVTLAGKFPPGVTTLSDRDGAVFSNASQTASGYSARVTIGAAEGPGYVKLWTFTPVSHVWSTAPVVFIDTVYRFDLKAANGYTVTVTPAAKSFTLQDRKATLEYTAEFFKPGEKTPFETRTGSMDFSDSEDTRARMDVVLRQPEGGAAKELDDIMKKMGDPKLTPAQQQDLTLQMVKAQQRMMDELTKANPADAQKKIDDFGCRILQVYPRPAGLEANFACGKNFNGGVLRTTGTMTQVK